MLCCSRAENSNTVILKSNMFSMIYNVWSWYDVKITQNYLLVLFLINIYSQDYNYTLKYSHKLHGFCSVHNHIFCSAVFILSTIVHILTDYNYSVYFTSSNMKISIFWVFSRRFSYWLRTLQISDRHFLDFEIQINKILIQYPTEMDFLLTC
jgi:hypothetical protein